MAKRYKKGNRKKKPKNVKPSNIFYDREKKLNRLINSFICNYYNMSYPPSEDEYEDMNNQRIEIKHLFHLQEDDLWKQSSRRNYFYRKQLSSFKYYYTAWKKFTYYIYLDQRFGIPKRFSSTLSFYRKHNNDVNSIRYQL